MKKNIIEQLIDLDQVTQRETEKLTNQTSNQTKKKKETEVIPKPQEQSGLKIGQQYELKPTRLYYLKNNNFIDSDRKWVPSSGLTVKYISVSKKDKNWILIEAEGNRYYIPVKYVKL